MNPAAAVRPITITSHVLDTAIGRPAAGIKVTLEAAVSTDKWREVCNLLLIGVFSLLLLLLLLLFYFSTRCFF